MAYDRSIFSSPAYWIALGAGVIGIGAAAMQGRRGSRSRETPYYIDDRRDGLKELRQLRYRADRWNPRYKGQGHPRDVIAGGTLEEIASDEAVLPGAAAAVANYRDRSARGSASTRYTPDFFWSQIVPSATRRAVEEKSPILVTFEERFNAWGMVSAAHQPRTRRTFAVVDAQGRVEQGSAWDASFDRGSAAVDTAKRYRDLQRMAAPGSGASDNERAMAKRLLATMTPPPQQAPRATRSSGAGYGYAPPRRQAQPWQTDPRDSTEIDRNDLTDLNFAKKSIYEHASAPRVRVTLHGFDGSYGRHALTAFSSLDDLGYAAKVLEAWGEPVFKRDGVFDAVIGMVEGESDARVLRIRGVDVSSRGLTLDHESFSRNPFNDASFARRLRALVEAQAQKMR